MSMRRNFTSGAAAITREQLQQLTKPELIEIILQLQVRVACPARIGTN